MILKYLINRQQFSGTKVQLYIVQTCEEFGLDAADGVFQGENEWSLRHRKRKFHKASV